MASPPIDYTEGALSNWRSDHGNVLPRISSLEEASRGTRGNFLALVSNGPEEILGAFMSRVFLYPGSVTEIASYSGLTEAYYGRGLLHITIRNKLLTLRAHSILVLLAATTPANNIIIDLRNEQGGPYKDDILIEILQRRGF